MQILEGLRYSADHEWVLVEGTRVRIGITDYAQDALGDVVYVKIPELGGSAASGQTISEVESTKSVSDIYAPLSGTIVEVNEALADTPEVLNADPYGAGWICVIEMSDPAELDSLLSAEAYQQLVGDG